MSSRGGSATAGNRTGETVRETDAYRKFIERDRSRRKLPRWMSIPTTDEVFEGVLLAILPLVFMLIPLLESRLQLAMFMSGGIGAVAAYFISNRRGEVDGVIVFLFSMAVLAVPVAELLVLAILVAVMLQLFRGVRRKEEKKTA